MEHAIRTLALERRIWLIRGKRVMLDADLAEIYGVATKRLNEQVKRNVERFPEDFMMRLTPREAAEAGRSRSQFAALKRGQNVKHSPSRKRGSDSALEGYFLPVRHWAQNVLGPMNSRNDTDGLGGLRPPFDTIAL